jgi:GTP-binding protein HflX
MKSNDVDETESVSTEASASPPIADERDLSRALVLHPVMPQRAMQPSRDDGDSLAEAVALTAALDLDVVDQALLPVRRPNPATLFGEGTVTQMAERAKQARVRVVFVNHALTPVQQRNLEKAWNAKVVDRTGLILEIFGARARTREGRLQVELATLGYQRSRLVRSWTHLERQRGGRGFLAGPGESQLEIDRRLIDDRIIRLKRELDEVERTRGLHRKARDRVPYPTVALVGYTNAGKSTLFNRMTGATVMAKDLLFATLDPTMRAVKLPSGRKIIIADTVGFIADLPTTLVAAFKATLEEVAQADLILHVRDIAHAETDAQREDVESVLSQLGIEPEGEKPIIEVWNKTDLLDPAERETLETATAALGAHDLPKAVAVSALTGEGMERLFAAIDHFITREQAVLDLAVPLTDGQALAWLYSRGDVLSREDNDEVAQLRIGLSSADCSRFRNRYPHYAASA